MPGGPEGVSIPLPGEQQGLPSPRGRIEGPCPHSTDSNGASTRAGPAQLRGRSPAWEVKAHPTLAASAGGFQGRRKLPASPRWTDTPRSKPRETERDQSLSLKGALQNTPRLPPPPPPAGAVTATGHHGMGTDEPASALLTPRDIPILSHRGESTEGGFPQQTQGGQHSPAGV